MSTDNASAVESVLQLRDLFFVLLSVRRQTFDTTSQHADLGLEVAQLRVLLIDLVSNVGHRLCRLLQPTTHVTHHQRARVITGRLSTFATTAQDSNEVRGKCTK